MTDPNDLNTFLNSYLHSMTKNYVTGLSETLKKEVGNNRVNVSDNVIKITYDILDQQSQSNDSFIDLKPYFKNSSKVKESKKGGWYLKIPVGGYKNSAQMRKAYGRSVWDDISHMSFGSTGGEGNADKIQKLLQGQSNQSGGFLNYDWKSSNITRVKAGSGKYGHYAMFRTVSDTSDPASWIVGRQGMNSRIDNYSDNGKQIADVLKQIISENVANS